MKKLFILLCAIANMALSAQEITDVEAKIDQVQVFLKGAIIKKKAQVSLKAGEQMLVFRDVPSGLQNELIQVKSAIDVKILNIQYRLVKPEEKKIQNTQSQDVELAKLRGKLSQNEKKLLALAGELKFINDRTTLFQNQDNPTPQQLREIDTYLAQRRESLLMKQLALEEEKSDINTQIQKLSSEVKQIRAQNSKDEYGIFVRVESKTPVRKTFEVEYFHEQAT